jgi:hypothetical protein
MSTFETIAANMRKAARDGEIVTIGGGEFGPDELRAAALALAAHDGLVAALQGVLPYVPGHIDEDTQGRPWLVRAHDALLKAGGQ